MSLILRILISLIVFFLFRYNQYKDLKKGVKFIIIHSVLDLLVLINPIIIIVSIILQFFNLEEKFDKIIFVYLSIYFLTFVLYLYMKKRYFRINKIEVDDGFPIIDIFMFILAFGTYEIINSLL